jgi:lysophospholipase L1-like esterase
MKTILSYVVALVFSAILLAGAEWLASATHLADRIAMLEDYSTIQRGHHLGSTQKLKVTSADGFMLYKPHTGDGVTINQLGLRTAPPSPKVAGERRIAILGGSVVWGYLLGDADTIPERLQQKVREAGCNDIAIYNFGIEGATIQRELALLKHFREIYQIDRAIFYTGGNDIFLDYFDVDGLPGQQTRPQNFLTTLELFKVADKIGYSWFPPAKARVQKLDDLMSHLDERSSLVRGIRAAHEYCRTTDLGCDFVLQPYLLTKEPLLGSEAKLVSSSIAVFPKLDEVVASAYRASARLGPFVLDFSNSLGGAKSQVFLDVMHLNEAGTDAAATALLPLAVGDRTR